jgi:hypothetical protein
LVRVGHSLLLTNKAQEFKPSEPNLTPMPMGGSHKGAQASADLTHRVKAKKQSVVGKSVPKTKIVSLDPDAELVLPETPISEIDLPEARGPVGGAIKSAGLGTGVSGAGSSGELDSAKPTDSC